MRNTFPFIIVISFIFCHACFYVDNEKTCQENFLTQDIHKSLEGLVKDKGFSRSRRVSELRFSNSRVKNIYGFDTSIASLIKIAEKGDSVIKHSRSLEYILQKPDTTLFFYPSCVDRTKLGKITNPYFEVDDRPKYIDKLKRDSITSKKWDDWYEAKRRQYEQEYREEQKLQKELDNRK